MPKCIAKTKKGTRCTRNVSTENTLCGQHSYSANVELFVEEVQPEDVIVSDSTNRSSLVTNSSSAMNSTSSVSITIDPNNIRVTNDIEEVKEGHEEKKERVILNSLAPPRRNDSLTPYIRPQNTTPSRATRIERRRPSFTIITEEEDVYVRRLRDVNASIRHLNNRRRNDNDRTNREIDEAMRDINTDYNIIYGIDIIWHFEEVIDSLKIKTQSCDIKEVVDMKDEYNKTLNKRVGDFYRDIMDFINLKKTELMQSKTDVYNKIKITMKRYKCLMNAASYKPPEKVHEKPEDCPICLEDISNVKNPLSCGHWVHPDCIMGCTKELCPLCRKKITYTID